MPDRFRAGKRLWNAEDDKLLRTRYSHESTATLARELRRSKIGVYARARTLGLAKTREYLARHCRLHIGAAYCFKPGHVPANKGMRRPGWGPGRMKETQFKKGQKSHNWRPVGAQRLVDGYLYTKVSDRRYVTWTRNWKPTHVQLWEKHRGRISRGHVLSFRNGDRRDIRLRNLKCITRRQNMSRNTVHNLPRPLVETIRLLGALNRQIRRRTCGHKEQDRRPA